MHVTQASEATARSEVGYVTCAHFRSVCIRVRPYKRPRCWAGSACTLRILMERVLLQQAIVNGALEGKGGGDLLALFECSLRASGKHGLYHSPELDSGSSAGN